MSLVRQQSAFLIQVQDLIRRAGELGFMVTGGELHRTAEQQELHVKNGRSKTMNSQHLKRLAMDLNFFREQSDGKLKLVYDVNQLRQIGDYWESLDPANCWGGNWNNFKDTPHFERREDRYTKVKAADDVEPEKSLRISLAGKKVINDTVGSQSPNHRDDVETVQRLLNICFADERFQLDAPLLSDGLFGKKTHAAICAYQESVLNMKTPDGIVSVSGPTIQSLFEALPDELNEQLISLLYIKADDADIQTLVPAIRNTMHKRAIDTPLRQAHFLAQIGHESGELRFREELASGVAYEGRQDLGNTEPGDGPLFKGRGLIQLTGRNNYTAYGRAIGKDLLDDPQVVAENPEYCVDVAGWYWERHQLNVPADRDDLEMVTRKINGGLNGLLDRRRLLEKAKILLKV